MVKSKSEQQRQTQTERSEATRAALLSAAHDLFAEHGYSGASSEAIVAAAGVSRGALQHHFVDKRSLFTAVYEQVESDVVRATAEAGMAVGRDDPLEVLRAGCHARISTPCSILRSSASAPSMAPPSSLRTLAVPSPTATRCGLVRETVQRAVEEREIVDAPIEPLTRMLLAAVIAAAQFVATAADPGGCPRRSRADG